MINNIKKIKKGLAPSATRGFTLVEMLVAVFLLITAVAGPLTIASRGLTASIVAKDQVTAFFLAQDAVEYVRYMRDSNRLAGNAWLVGLSNCISTDGSQACILDSTENSATPPSQCAAPTTCTILRYDSSNGRFTYSTVGSTISPISLRRAVSIETPLNGSANEAAVTVTVTWSDQANITRSVVVRENILDWQ